MLTRWFIEQYEIPSTDLVVSELDSLFLRGGILLEVSAR